MNEIHKIESIENNENSTYNPDKRIEQENKTDNTEQYDPDKRIEKKDELDEVIDEYYNDLKNNSDCPETLPDKPFDKSQLEKISPKENAKMREEFDEKKADLKKEWERINGRPWPKYEHDVYSSNGKLIRKAGTDYDAHHIQPLSLGGKNMASNITPLHAGVHYDRQGVHSPDSTCSKLDNMVGGK